MSYTNEPVQRSPVCFVIAIPAAVPESKKMAVKLLQARPLFNDALVPSKQFISVFFVIHLFNWLEELTLAFLGSRGQ